MKHIQKSSRKTGKTEQSNFETKNAEYKRFKNYNNELRKATHLDIGVGKLFLTKYEQQGKTQTAYAPDPAKVAD